MSDQVSINVTMEVGQSSQTVQVTAESPLLDTSSASMGQVVDSRTIMELPLKDGMVLTHGDACARRDLHAGIGRLRAPVRYGLAIHDVD